MRHEAENDPDAYADAIDRWTTYCERLGIGGIAVGAVILRRRAGDNWVRADQLPAERLVLDGHARLEQRVVYGDGAWNVEEIGVALEDGLGFTAKLDSATAGMPAALDRTRTLGDVAGDPRTPRGLSREEVERGLLPVAAEMLATGFLVRA